MEKDVNYKKYDDVSVIIYSDKSSGIITSKLFDIHRNINAVTDRLRVMCLSNDLNYRSMNVTPVECKVICSLKRFDSLKELDSHIRIKFLYKDFSVIHKGRYVLVKTKNKSYIYIINDEASRHE